MSHVLAIAKKELRAYFLSPVALIFLATFLATTLYCFFWLEGFFVRNVADIRPLFAWLPILLIFLVAALTMRLWSEEQKLGTLEILMTLPVPTHKLVAGKFLGGLALIALALVLTIGIPITVALLGDLDWGPVIGGYLASLLLAGAYLAIGMTLSSLTENQIVALIETALACALLYAIGTESVAGLFPTRTADLLRAIGIGSRFDSIGRGVIDLRDLTYYGSLILFFLALNTVILESKRWSAGASTRSMRDATKIGVALTAANLLILNLWLAPVQRARVDLTARHEYTVSKTTKDMLQSLSAPLILRGYFSERVHPKLAPLVELIKDMMREYAASSDGRVIVEFVDPHTDKDAEKEANEAYGIKSQQFQMDSHVEQGVLNSYFSILVKYGDQHEVLGFGDLIEVQQTKTDVDVRLKGLEYDLTKTIKKVAYGFQTLESMFADIKTPLEVTAYITPKTLPPNFKDAPDRIKKVLEEVSKSSNGKLTYSVIDPDASPGLREELYKREKIRPQALMFAQESFYLTMLLKTGDRSEPVYPRETMSEAEIKAELIATIKRNVPGFSKTVGLVKPKGIMPPQDPRIPPQQQQQQQPQDVTRMIQEQLGINYTVKPIDLKDGRVPGEIDVLVVVAPNALEPAQVFAIDQYLMRGGSVAILGGKFEIKPDPHTGIVLERVTTGLEDALATYGVTIQDKLVLDPQNEAYPQQVTRDLGGMKVRDVKLMRYPFFVDVRGAGMSKETPLTNGLNGITLQWVSPIVVSDPPAPKAGEEPGKRSVSVLFTSTDKAWASSSVSLDPDFEKNGELGFAIEGERKSFPLGVTMQGRFDSAFKGKPTPVPGAAAIESSPETARLTVVASSSFLNDMVLNLSRQVAGQRFTSALQLGENIVDWSTTDSDLLSIRSQGTFARTLLPKTAGERLMYEYANYIAVLIALGAIVLLTFGRRRRMKPIILVGARPARPVPTVTIEKTEAHS